ncbi:MAG: FtsW/RodA/SpoVE family cell cycle protein [Bacteroidaceae bacterium]|nr:FtsW/RodA/SpoVE family cell cycle protein [Bacteroidaceae bacterium]
MLKTISNNLFKGDKGVWMIFFFLCMISLVEIYSASSSLTYQGGNHWDPMIRQAGFLTVGLILILVITRIPCKYFKLVPFLLYPTAILLLLYVLIFGGSINGGSRWIDLGMFSFQPSEIAKGALIMSLAAVLSMTQNKEEVTTRKGTKQIVTATRGGHSLPFRICAILTIVMCSLIVTENFSTAAILFSVAVIMMFIGNIPIDLMVKSLLLIGLVVAASVALLLTTPDSVLGNIGGRPLTWKHRIESKLHIGEEENVSTAYNIEDNWQEDNANIAIANSNIIGRGPGNSIQRDFLSHAESDFIYSIIIEETGLLGGLFVIFLYIVLLIRASRIAQKCDRFFPAFLVMGITIIMVLQAMINMGVAVGLFPVTGQPLPLISKGGTSILITCCYFGIILSISRYAEKINETKNAPAEAISSNETDEYYSSTGLE